MMILDNGLYIMLLSSAAPTHYWRGRRWVA